ncbi:MAG: hypothetical protein M0R46_09890 [Candidatus Muirbacterium halophilum]|nr:hypothetical protein [Candidatus Muirbacterium halophilum]
MNIDDILERDDEISQKIDKKKEIVDDAKSIGSDIDKISKEATKIKEDQLAQQRKFVSLESDNMTKHFANMLKELEQNIAKFFELLKILLLAQDEEKKVQNSQNTNMNNINPDSLKALMSDDKFLAYVKQRSVELEKEITEKINILFAENTVVADELVYKFQEYKNEEKIDNAKVTSFIDMLNKKYDENISKKIVVEVEDETLNNDKNDMAQDVAQEKNEEKITVLKQQKHKIQKQ